MTFDRNLLDRFPHQPGVYFMKDVNGHILYIGKAKDLQKRIKQYFSPTQDLRETVPILMAQVADIDTIVTIHEHDALLLENTLIKKHQPKYNILLKDDKTFISLLITRHAWPMLQIVRYKGRPKKQGNYFGPYTSALAARQIYDLISRISPLRQCSDSEFASRKRACLLYDIKKCLGPCVGLCTRDQYQVHIDAITRLLKGQNQELLKELNSAMKDASDRLEFEQAAELLKLIHQIEHVTTVQHVAHPTAKDCDVLGIHRMGHAVMIALLQFRNGSIVASKHYGFHFIASTDEEIFESFILQHYSIDEALPKEILVPTTLMQAHVIENIFSEQFNKSVAILTPQKGVKHDLITMAMRNATAQFQREEDERSLKEQMLLALQETLQLNRYPRRIECFDTAHISGSDAVASLCVFVNGERDKSQTRLFKIKTAPSGDDYAALREILLRHFSKEKQKQSFCDLLIVDGGKGQLNTALSVFQELDIATIDVIALTKEDARHDKGLTQEKVYVPHSKDPLFIDPRSPLLFLLQRIRDEAHRLAISFHRKRRTKRVMKNELEEIPGIGPVKRKRLLSHFKSFRAIKNATEQELCQIPGITKIDVEHILHFIANESKS